MSALGRAVFIIALAVVAAGGGYWYGRNHAAPEAEHGGATTSPSESESESEDKPVVSVQTTPLKKGQISEVATAYGSVIAEASDVRAMSVLFESRVVHVLVTPGQSIAAGTELVEVEASPDAQIAFQEAKNALEAATVELKQTEQRFADHLATNSEQLQARQAQQAAELKLKSLTDRGVGEAQHVKAQFAGIVSKVDVQEGQIVAAGLPLVELAAGNRLEARLGVEPSDAQSLQAGQTVKLIPMNRGVAASEPIEGKIRTVGWRVDPATRMVEVLVTLPDDSKLLLDSFVAGELTRLSSDDALIVPRDAALPGENGQAIVYTVRDGKAVKHTVHLGLENDREVQVIADDLKPDDPVVITGNYLLEDGMSVEAKP